MDTDGNDSPFLQEQLAHLHTGNTQKKVPNIASDEDIMENNYMFLMLWNLSVIHSLLGEHNQKIFFSNFMIVSYWWFVLFLVPYRQSQRGLWVCTLSVCQSVRLSVHSISFLDFFPKCLQILSWFLACKSITMTYRSSLSFVTLYQFLAKLRALDLENFNFLDFFSKRLLILTWFLACKSVNMTYK